MTEMTPEEALSLVRERLQEIDESIRKGATKAWLRTAIGDVWRYLDPDADWGRSLLHRPKVLADGWAAKDNPFKVRTPRGAADDIAVFIVEAQDE